MSSLQQHLFPLNRSVREALIRLDQLASDAILFLTDEEQRLYGSVTDGDLRRGFIQGLGFEDPIGAYAQLHPKTLRQGSFSLNELIEWRKKKIDIVPVLDEEQRVVEIINLRHHRSFLPIDAVLMAGGRGERLRPLTDRTPKPMLKVGDKPIIEHNIDRLADFGVQHMWISIRYLGEQIVAHFGDGKTKGLSIRYIEEDAPLGTMGALTLAEGWSHDTVLVMNSDLLTDINFEEFYLFFEQNEADFAVACIPYKVNVPYAVMETDGLRVTGFREKPDYTHFSNAGIYLMKRDLLSFLPQGEAYNATDLMESLIKAGKRVLSFPLVGYWRDIGKHEDFQKAQEELTLLNL